MKGRIKPDHIAQVVVAGFAVVANASGRPWWAVQSKPAEVDPWTPAAAELANKYIPDDETAEKVLDSFAVGQIVLGLGSMITQRIAQDREVAATLARRRMEEQRERVEELRRQEGIETPTAERSNGTEPGKVSRTIPGFGEPQAGLA